MRCTCYVQLAVHLLSASRGAPAMCISRCICYVRLSVHLLCASRGAPAMCISRCTCYVHLAVHLLCASSGAPAYIACTERAGRDKTFCRYCIVQLYVVYSRTRVMLHVYQSALLLVWILTNCLYIHYEMNNNFSGIMAGSNNCILWAKYKIFFYVATPSQKCWQAEGNFLSTFPFLLPPIYV